MNYSPLVRRAAAVGAGLLLGAVAFVAPAAAQGADPTPSASIEASAECWPYGEDNSYQWDVWFFVANGDEGHGGWIETVSLTVDPESAEDSVELNGLVEGSAIDAGSESHGKIELPPDTEVTRIGIEVTVGWEIDGVDYSAIVDASVELDPALCAEVENPVGELPSELGHWSVDCDQVEILFSNPFQERLEVSFESSAGDVATATVDPFESATVTLPSAEGAEISMLVNGDPITDPIVISSEDWAELGCPSTDEGDIDQGGTAGGGLPVTGTSTWLLVGGALFLLAAGGGAFVLARRRQVTFTA